MIRTFAIFLRISSKFKHTIVHTGVRVPCEYFGDKTKVIQTASLALAYMQPHTPSFRGRVQLQGVVTLRHQLTPELTKRKERVHGRLTNRYYNKPSYSYKCKYHNKQFLKGRVKSVQRFQPTIYHLSRSTLIVACITGAVRAKQHERASCKMPRSPRLAHKAPVMQVTLIAVEYSRKGKVYLSIRLD